MTRLKVFMIWLLVVNPLERLRQFLTWLSRASCRAALRIATVNHAIFQRSKKKLMKKYQIEFHYQPDGRAIASWRENGQTRIIRDRPEEITRELAELEQQALKGKKKGN